MKSKTFLLSRNLIFLLAGRVIFDTGSCIQMMIIPLFIIDRGGDVAMVEMISKGGMPLAALLYGLNLNRFPLHNILSITAVFLISRITQQIKVVEEIKVKVIGGSDDI